MFRISKLTNVQMYVGGDWYWELNETLVLVLEFVYSRVSCEISAQYETSRML